MRWFFLILLVLNIALFAWFQQERDMRNRLASRTEFSGVDVEPLRLLSEVKLKVPLRRSAGRGGAAADDSAVVGCYVIGDFATAEAAEQFRQQRMPETMPAVVVRVARDQSDYQVYVRAPDEVPARRKLLRRLQDSGLEVSVIRRGSLAGALSLGVYQNQSLAMALHDALKAQSYDISIFEQQRPRTGFVIETRVEDSQSGAAVWLSGFAGSGGAVKSEKKVCEGVASTRDPE